MNHRLISMNKIFRCSLLAFITLWLTGCGLKGPLYMPSDEAPKSKETISAAQPEPDTQTTDDTAK